MLKKLSGLPDERLTYYLARIREISAHDEIAALIETDKLIWELAFKEEAFEWTEDEEDFGPFGIEAKPNYQTTHDIQESQHYYRDQQEWLRLTMNFDTVEEDLARQLQQIQNGELSFEFLYGGAYARMRRWPERMYQAIEQQAKHHTQEELDTWKAAADRIENVLQQFEPLWLDKAIKQAMKAVPRNIVGIESEVRSLDRCVGRYLERCPVLPEDTADRVRDAKVRLISIRARKKMDMAGASAKAGRLVKAQSEYREAYSVLEIDWKLGFPEETQPTGDLANQLRALILPLPTKG